MFSHELLLVRLLVMSWKVMKTPVQWRRGCPLTLAMTAAVMIGVLLSSGLQPLLPASPVTFVAAMCDALPPLEAKSGRFDVGHEVRVSSAPDNSAFVNWISWASLAGRLGPGTGSTTVSSKAWHCGDGGRGQRRCSAKLASLRKIQQRRALFHFPPGTPTNQTRGGTRGVGLTRLSPSPKPILLYFHQDQCEPCRALDAQMKASAEFELLAPFFYLVSVEHLDSMVQHPFPQSSALDEEDENEAENHRGTVPNSTVGVSAAASNRRRLARREAKRATEQSSSGTHRISIQQRKNEWKSNGFANGDRGTRSESEDDDFDYGGETEKLTSFWTRQYLPQGDYLPRVLFLYPNNGSVANVVNTFADKDHVHFYHDISLLLISMKEALRVIGSLSSFTHL